MVAARRTRTRGIVHDHVRLLNGSATVAAGAPDGGATVARPLKNIMNFFRPGSRLIKMVERIARGEPEIGDAYLAGEIGLREAEAAASLPAGEQREAVEGGIDGIKDKALEVRDRRGSAGGLDRASSLSRREAEWRRERERPLPEPPPIGPRRAALTDDEAAQLEDLQALFARAPAVVQEAHARLIFEVTKKAASPEQLEELAAQYPPEPAAYDGMAASQMLKLGDALKRAMPHNGMVLELCQMVESSVVGRGVAQRRV
jgi:hypothetical protein